MPVREAGACAGADEEQAEDQCEGAGGDVGVEGPVVGAPEVGGSAVEEVGREVGWEVVVGSWRRRWR